MLSHDHPELNICSLGLATSKVDIEHTDTHFVVCTIKKAEAEANRDAAMRRQKFCL